MTILSFSLNFLRLGKIFTGLNLTEPYNQGMKVLGTTKDVKKQGRLCMESPPREA